MKKVFLSGVGGIGVSALAKFLYTRGYSIYGSDVAENENIEFLKEKYNLVFYNEQKAENITSDFDFLIYTPAIGEDAPERKQAHRVGVLQYSYPEYLGKISEEKFTISVSGTNGKTTTTTMVSELLDYFNFDPTVIIGGVAKKFNSNFRFGSSDIFVVEACEYKNSFFNIFPDVAIITNITPDHLDFFGTFENMVQSFVSFVDNIKKNGYLICDMTDPILKPIILKARRRGVKVINYANYKIESTTLGGEYNKKNASASLALCNILDFSLSKARLYLEEEFQGSKRRFEKIGVTVNNAIVYDDYAHNPEELKVFFQALKKKYSDKKNVIVFQPHMYSRTADFFDEFVEVLKEPDLLFLEPIYSPRSDEKKITTDIFVDAVLTARMNRDTFFCKDHSDCVKKINEMNFSDDYVIATVGASDINKVAEKLVL